MPLTGRVRANDSEALMAAAEAGFGVALLPHWIAGETLRTGRLVAVLPAFEAIYAPGELFIWAVYPPKRVVAPKVRAFIDGFAAFLGSPPYWERT